MSHVLKAFFLIACTGAVLSSCASYLSVQTDIYTGEISDIVVSKTKVEAAKKNLQEGFESLSANADSQNGDLRVLTANAIESILSFENRFSPNQASLHVPADDPIWNELERLEVLSYKVANDMNAKPEVKSSAHKVQSGVEKFIASSLHDAHLGEILKPENEHNWRNSPANGATVFTFFGNAEVLVRQDKRQSSDAGGEFHIKGVIFDPSQVSEAVFTAVELSIRVLATAYGVPTIGNSSTAPAEPTGRLAFRARELKAESSSEQTLIEMQSAYLEILREIEALPSTLVAADVDRIRGVLEAARDKLKSGAGDS